MKTKAELTNSLHTLRLLVREVGGNYLASLQSDVARIEQVLKTAEHVNDKQLTAMLKAITRLDIKPQKGRRRDLKELDRLISKLSDMADNW
jgi:hypothetical protein